MKLGEQTDTPGRKRSEEQSKIGEQKPTWKNYMRVSHTPVRTDSGAALLLSTLGNVF